MSNPPLKALVYWVYRPPSPPPGEYAGKPHLERGPNKPNRGQPNSSLPHSLLLLPYYYSSFLLLPSSFRLMWCFSWWGGRRVLSCASFYQVGRGRKGHTIPYYSILFHTLYSPISLPFTLPFKPSPFPPAFPSPFPPVVSVCHGSSWLIFCFMVCFFQGCSR